METGRRAFLGTLGAGLVGARFARAQSGAGAPQPKVRKAKTATLFKSPEGYPNAITATKEGLWIGEQKSDHACLVDWNGKLLKTVTTEAKNTSGMGIGGGFIWMGANAAPNGIFQTDMSSKTVSHRQIPLGGGGCHGVEYVDGKLWIAALRLRGILRVDAKTWEPELMIPYAMPRAHGVATEALTAVIAHTFSTLPFDELWVRFAIDHAAAKSTARSAGLVRHADASPQDRAANLWRWSAYRSSWRPAARAANLT